MKTLLLLLLVFAAAAAAEPRKHNAVAVCAVQGVDTDLPQLPKHLFGGTLVFEDARLYTLSYVRDLAAYPIGYTRLHLGIEGVLGKHDGIQNHLETALAFQLKLSGILPPKSPFNIDYAVADGLSYAFDEPRYEDTPENEPDRYYRLQNFISMDFDFYARTCPSVQLMLRLHHRSGVYGLIAPPKVGSNFIGYGVKYLF